MTYLLTVTISFKPILIHGSFFFFLYLFFCWFYRNKIRPRYRWEQKGNVCHDDKRFFGIVAAIVFGGLVELLVHGLLFLKWN